MSIKRKLTIAVLVIALVPLAGAGVLAYRLAKQSLTAQVLDHLESVAAVQRARLESVTQQNIEKLQLVSSRTQMRRNFADYLQSPNDELRRKLNAVLQDARDAVPTFRTVSLLGPSGEVVASTDPARIGASLGRSEAFLQG